MAVSFMKVAESLAFRTTELPQSRRPGRAQATLPAEVVEVVSSLAVGEYAPIAVVTNPDSEAKAELIGTVGKLNRAGNREGYLFVLRTDSEGIARIYGGNDPKAVAERESLKGTRKRTPKGK